MSKEEKIQRIIIISIIGISIIIILLVAYLVNTFSSDESLSEEEYDSESASTEIGKSVEESIEEYETAEITETENTTDEDIEEETTDENSTTQNTVTGNTTTNNTTTSNESTSSSESKEETDIEEDTETEEKEVTFEVPIQGEIIREFVTDSLVYSDTLKEWVTHNGVDIKADKTSVVSASADGTVYAIKNDPRYGLTVIINHDDGYQTIYSNLLTAEFVVEGEEVTQGQSIGTVGNSATFEIADEYHLHFELLKDDEYLDPTIYMNFE